MSQQKTQSFSYLQEKRGKVFVPKEEDMKLDELNGEGDGSDLKTDFDDILNQATEEELVDLAGKQHNGITLLLYLLYFQAL